MPETKKEPRCLFCGNLQQQEVPGTGFVLAMISCNLDPEDGDIFRKPSQADFGEVLPPEYINWEATKHRRR